MILLSSTVGEAFLTAVDMRENPELSGKVQMLCVRIRKYTEQIDNYLVKISGRDIGSRDRAFVSLLSMANASFGRMGKVAERLVEIAESIAATAEMLTEDDLRDMGVLGGSIYEIMQLTINGYSARTKAISQTIRYYREEIMKISEIAKSRFIRRIHEEGRERTKGSYYTDICYAQEQLIDYCDMIADALIRYDMAIGEKESSDAGTDEQTRQQIHAIFRDKYELLEGADRASE